MTHSETERFLELLDRRQVSPAEFQTLLTIGSGPVPWRSLAEFVTHESRDDPLGTAAPHEYAAACTACLQRGWLRAMDDEAVEELEALVEASGLVGPIYGYPRPGEVDFTPAGAETFWQLREALFGSDYAIDHVYEVRRPREQRVRFYCRTRRGIMRAVYDCEHRYDVVLVSDPRPIGPWCVWWWEHFPEGYRMTADLVG